MFETNEKDIVISGSLSIPGTINGSIIFYTEPIETNNQIVNEKPKLQKHEDPEDMDWINVDHNDVE